jgi:hypothetical protein
LVSVIEQNIEAFDDFINDITIHKYCVNGYDEDNSQGYTNGRIRILIEKPDDEKESDYMVDAYYDYCYYIEFLYDERNWGYCECSPEDEGYNEEHNCCGCGCDWIAPSFRLTKEISMGGASWNGYARDYWEYKEKFYNSEKNKNEEVEKYQKEQRRKSLKEQIERLKAELKEL